MNTGKLVQALRAVLRAEQEEQEARAGYQGYEWGYHGFRYAEECKRAGDEFAAALDAVIDSRVCAVLADLARNTPSNPDA